MEQNIGKLSEEVEKEIDPIFKKIDKICSKNSKKVLDAFQKCNLQEIHLNSSTGYGIDEPGRNKIEEIYSNIFKAEDALVRTQLISGTHALAVTLSALLRPQDTLLSITGSPYDTLQTVIGVSGNSKSSLKEYGIKYEQIELIDSEFDTEKIIKRLSKNDVKVVEIQRSRGYSTRKSLKIEQIEEIIKEIRKINKEVIIMVDNCYGEFVQEKEPIEVGADIAVRFINEKSRSRNCNFRSIYCRKKRFNRIMCRKINISRNRKRDRTIFKSKPITNKRTIFCTICCGK